MNRDLSLILSKIYGWLGLLIYALLMFQSPADNFWAFMKFVVILAFLYEKLNWRMLVLVLCVWSIVYGLFTLTNIGSVIDIFGFGIITYYSLKYRV